MYGMTKCLSLYMVQFKLNNYGPERRPYSNQRVRSLARSFVCSFVRLFICSFVCSFVRSFVRSFIRSSISQIIFFWWVVVCVRFSSKTTWLISPMLIPIYRGNNVDLQLILHFDLHPSMTAGQGHEIPKFCEFRCLAGSSLCSLLRNYFTEFSNADTNLPREQCIFAMYTSFWPSPLHHYRSTPQNTAILWI